MTTLPTEPDEPNAPHPTATAPANAPATRAPWHGRRRPATAWLSLRELVRSGIQASKATDFGEYADARRSQAARPFEIYRTTGSRDHYVIDYLADTGDGYDATYAVARSVLGSAEGAQPAEHSDLLVLGGDQVYPVASVQNYDDRLKTPFLDARTVRAAQLGVDRTHLPDFDGLVAAIPGNHDWYDGLVAFERNFAEGYIKRRASVGPPQGPEILQVPAALGDRMLGRNTFQSRSYFALQLPHGWWLWGVDIQLDSYIDAEQLAYFSYARHQIADHERVILCTARPSWTDDRRLDQGYYTTNRETLTWFVNRFFATPSEVAEPAPDHPVPLVLTGDKHHYVHYRRAPGSAETPNPAGPQHLVTCGGGGAYLSSTHHMKDPITVPWQTDARRPSRYELRETFPTVSDSKALRRQFWRIPLLNGVLTPLLVALVGIGLTQAYLRPGPGNVAALGGSGALMVLLITLSHAFRLRGLPAALGLLPGFLHGTAQLTTAFLVAALLRRDAEVSTLFPGWGTELGWLVVPAATALVLFTLYWPLCDLAGFHENELFSGMKLSGYKSHLRLVISPTEAGGSGRLLITPYFIREVPWNLPRRLLFRPLRDDPPVVTTGTAIEIKEQPMSHPRQPDPPDEPDPPTPEPPPPPAPDPSSTPWETGPHNDD